jgi:hypothetical protein
LATLFLGKKKKKKLINVRLNILVGACFEAFDCVAVEGLSESDKLICTRRMTRTEISSVKVQ